MCGGASCLGGGRDVEAGKARRRRRHRHGLARGTDHRVLGEPFDDDDQSCQRLLDSSDDGRVSNMVSFG